MAVFGFDRPPAALLNTRKWEPAKGPLAAILRRPGLKPDFLADLLVPKGDVYRCQRVIAYEFPGSDEEAKDPRDWALIEVKPLAAGGEHTPLKIAGAPPRMGLKIAAIGHAFGLPQRAVFGSILPPTGEHFLFPTNLSLDQGASGGPVIVADARDADVGKVIGIVQGLSTPLKVKAGDPEPRLQSDAEHNLRVTNLLAVLLKVPGLRDALRRETRY